jgi:hypothetical protein
MRFSCFYLVKQKIHPTSIISGYRLACKEAVKYIQDHLTYKVSKSEQIFTVLQDRWIRYPGCWKNPDTESLDDHPRSFFREPKNSF